MPSWAALERDAANIVHILQGIGEYSDAEIVIIGGLALWKYKISNRNAKTIDILLNVGNEPQRVKEKLLTIPNSPFFQPTQILYYQNPSGHRIHVSIIPKWQFPSISAKATKLGNLPAGAIPYVTATDLVVFTVKSGGVWTGMFSNTKDASNVESLLERLTVHAPLDLTDDQRDAVERCFENIIVYGRKTKGWWRQRLGLSDSR